MLRNLRVSPQRAECCRCRRTICWKFSLRSPPVTMRKSLQPPTETLKDESVEDLLIAATGQDTAPNVLAYLATQTDGKQEIYEATILNTHTPDQALAKLAATTSHSSLLELLTINQQRLVRCPEIIDAILRNPARSGEAERRARETHKEFFEKERGARQIADELRARGQTAAAEFFEAAELTTAAGELSLEDAWLIASTSKSPTQISTTRGYRPNASMS